MTHAGDSPIYRDLMRFKPEELSPNAWAVKAGVSRTVWTDMRRHGNPSRRTLEKLLSAAGSSLLEFEALRVAPEVRQPAVAGAGGLEDAQWGWNAPALPPLPLFASRSGGEWPKPGSGISLTEIDRRRLVERLTRPPSLAADSRAYAVTIMADSMWPRFRSGSRVAVSPLSAANIGDDVLVKLRPAPQDARRGVEMGLIMQLAARTPTQIGLRQFNPDRTIRLDIDAVETIEKIAGELI